jgi:hypothetical protein
MRTAIGISFFFLLLACAGTNPGSRNTGTVDLEPNAYGVRALHKSQYKLGEAVVIILENDSDTMAYLFQPNYITIQRLVDSNWVDLRVIPCPCGAPCAPPGYQALEPYQIMDIQWDQRESWCDFTKNDSLGQLIRNEVRPGNFRWLIRSNDSPERDQVDDLILSLEFLVK